MRRDEVRRLCELAQLYMEPSELDGFAREMGEIIGFVQTVCRVQGLNGTKILEEKSPAVLREDVPALCEDRTGQKCDGFFLLSGKK